MLLAKHLKISEQDGVLLQEKFVLVDGAQTQGFGFSNALQVEF